MATWPVGLRSSIATRSQAMRSPTHGRVDVPTLTELRKSLSTSLSGLPYFRCCSYSSRQILPVEYIHVVATASASDLLPSDLLHTMCQHYSESVPIHHTHATVRFLPNSKFSRSCTLRRMRALDLKAVWIVGWTSCSCYLPIPQGSRGTQRKAPAASTKALRKGGQHLSTITAS